MTRSLFRVLLAAGLIAGCGSSGSIEGTDGSAGDGGTDVSAAPQMIVPPEQTTLDGRKVPKYVDDVPTFNGRRIDGKAAVTVDMVEFQQKVLPATIYANLPAPFNAGTYLWGYKVNGGAPSFPSTTIEATRGTATSVTYSNSLEGTGGAPLFLQRRMVTDLSVHSADALGFGKSNNCLSEPPLPPACIGVYQFPIPAVAHLHGAEVLSDFDGMPDTWFTAGMTHKGPAFVSNVYMYPNTQEATTLWFHDHALGLTRQHVYAGLAGFYLIRDANDTGAAGNSMSLPAGAYESELMVADRQFDLSGQLYFPAGLPGSAGGINGGPPNPDHHPYWIPEFFGDVVTVNGKSWPVMHVEPRRYRLRFVNASNARFFQMQLFAADTAGAPTDTAGPSFWQIGSDGGFLNAATNLDSNPVPGIWIAPAERADVIVDFTGKTGSFILTNGKGCDDPTNADSCGAFAPFPSGDPPDAETSGQVMMFTVDKTLAGTDTSFNPAPSGTAVRGGGPGRPATIVNVKPAGAPDVRRQLVLVEVEGPGGPEEVLLNNSEWDGYRENLVPGSTPVPIAGSVSNGHGIMATENPQVGATEIWEVANLTEDAHPIHIHLIQFQLINREAMVVGADGGDTIYRGDWDAAFPGGTFNGETFDPATYIPGYGPPNAYATANGDGALGGNVAFSGTKYLMGSPTAPTGNESGWKDTIKMLPKTVTRIAVRYAPQDTPLNGTGAAAAGTNRFTFDPTAPGPGYVWHCHILDHEDNEMMRPYVLKK